MADRKQAPASAIVLAGGQSRRLGREKALLEIAGQPLLARTVHTLAPLSDDIVVVTNQPARYANLNLPVRFVPDDQAGVGSLMGIYSGIKAVRHPWALAVACDMPFLNADLLRYMLSLTPGYDVVIPHLPEGLEPLHAIYNHRCRSPMGRLLAQGHRKIIAFFPEVRVRYVTEEEIDLFDPQRRSFINVNTPQDWERVQRMLTDEI